MSLEKWVEYGWLRREPTSLGEIKDLLGIVERSLADSRVEAVSTDLRFIAAFTAALGAATTALRASGHRTVTQAGHHVKTIESLELTIRASSSHLATAFPRFTVQIMKNEPVWLKALFIYEPRHTLTTLETVIVIHDQSTTN